MDQIQKAENEFSSVEFEALPVGVPTRNNRIYPREVMEKALKKYQEQIDQRRALVTTYSEGGMVNLKDTVGLVTEATIRDNVLVAKIRLLKTPALDLLISDGKFNQEFFRVAPFGVGTLKDNVVQDDFEIVGFHIDPIYERRNED